MKRFNRKKGTSMKNKKDYEEILLNNKTMDDLIKMKIENEFKKNITNSNRKKQTRIITDIKKAPKDKIFTKAACFKIYNRITGTETMINGIQAEGMLGLQNTTRTKLLNGEISAFSTDDAYIKFEKLCLHS